MKIYLACPFSHKYFWMRWYRFWVVTRCAAKLMQDGYVVFSPISHSFPVAWFLPKKLMQCWDFWKKQDFAWVKECDVFFILMLPGWKDSTGVNDEWSYAAGKFKRVVQFYPHQIFSGDYGI